MKNYLIMIFVLLLISCSNSTNIIDDEELSNEFLKVTDDIPPFEFESIKNFILTYGDVLTYRTFDGNNPHYAVDSFHCYLNSEIGQKNMWNDPELSDFNEITIQDIPRKYSEYVYLTLKIVRDGDKYNADINVKEGMKAGNVYLLNNFDQSNDLDLMRKSLQIYLNKIRIAVSNE